MRTHRALIAAIAALLAGSNSALAQENTGSPRFGFLVGRSLSDITDLGISNVLLEASGIEKSTRGGNQIAAYLTLPLSSRFALQPEIHYVQKGATFRLTGSGAFPGEDPEPLPPGAELELRLAYLEVPVLARLDLGATDGTLKPFLVAGPSVALRGSCQYGLTVGSIDLQLQCDESEEVGTELPEETDHIRKYDYGVVVGGGVAIRVFGFPASLQARYGRSLSPLAKDDTETNAKSTVMSFLFGIGF